jgi:hypothetical protein
MAKPKTIIRDDPPQSDRFIEAARKEGIEEVGEAFKRGLGRLAPKAKPIPKVPASKPKRAKRG